MTPYKQTVGHDPEQGIFGDCYRTAVGCLMDLSPDQVPHWYEGCGPDESLEDDLARLAAMQQWLNCRGYHLVRIYYRDDSLDRDFIMESMAVDNPGVYYILSGESVFGTPHSVICMDDTMVHDPSPMGTGIVGPLPGDARYYCVEFLVPVSQTIRGPVFRGRSA